MKAKKMLITILILCFIVTGCTACSSGSVDDAASSEKTEEQDNAVNKTENINMAPSEGELGNPNTNLVDDGLVAKKDSWIYFEFEGDLYKSKEDTSERQKLYDVDDGEYVAKINVIGDWVYFLQFSLNGGGIYKIKTDGTENQQICSESVEHLYIIDEWLYYKIHNDATIYRMKTDGSEQQIFCASDDVDIDNKNTEVESIQEVVSNQPINLSNTYKTRYAEINMVSAPEFQFGYPDNWGITTEIINGEYGLSEILTIANERGVEITFATLGVADVTDYGRTMYRVAVSKVGDSSFVPGYVSATDYSSLGKFVIAKLKVVGSLSMDTDSDYKEVDGAVYYAILPENLVGIKDCVRNCGMYNGFSFMYFNYSSSYAFFASAPDGQFTEQEEKEVIAILSSFSELI